MNNKLFFMLLLSLIWAKVLSYFIGEENATIIFLLQAIWSRISYFNNSWLYNNYQYLNYPIIYPKEVIYDDKDSY